MKKLTIISIVVASLMIAIPIVIYSVLNQMNHVEIDKTNEALGIIEEEAKTVNKEVMAEPEEKERDDVVNIALFGLDRIEPSGNARSDTIMIFTVDFKNKKVKLSSLMRDMYVEIEGYGNTKLNHAYAYGGATLSIKTINQNFGTNIRDYAMVDFFTLEKIINVLGGVTVDVKQEEIPYIEENINEEEITAGEQLLTGSQAVSYSRIRYVGNGDFERTERQRKVLSLVMDKAIEKGVSAVPSLVSEILPLVETSMDKQTILNSALDFFKAGEMTCEQVRFPVDGYYWNDMTTGIYYLKFDTELTKQQIMDYIYNDIKPTPKQ